jgi:hypothetical protein
MERGVKNDVHTIGVFALPRPGYARIDRPSVRCLLRFASRNFQLGDVRDVFDRRDAALGPYE